MKPEEALKRLIQKGNNGASIFTEGRNLNFPVHPRKPGSLQIAERRIY